VVGLVLVSLVLLTVSFRSSALDPVEGFGASVLRPFEIAANRVARPFRDAASWTNGLFDAKAQNKRLRREIATLQRQKAALKGAAEENALLHKFLLYVRSPSFPKDYDEVAAEVLTGSTAEQTITISAGTHSGIVPEDVVVTDQGLVGTITKVFASSSLVTLITNPNSGVRAVDETSLSDVGVLDHGAGSSLVLDNVGKDKQKVGVGDTIITAGSPAGSKLSSLFPRDIRIGYVSSSTQIDTEIYQNIQVEPFVDFSSLESVLVLVPKPVTVKQGGAGR
jgi:rod shape-determining protein MreC